MFELGGVTVTLGMIVLALAIVTATGWLTRRRPYVVVAMGALIGAVHAVAYRTAYLDPARLADARETAFEAAIETFFAGAAGLDAAFAATRQGIERALDGLAATSMPATSVSVLEFGTFLLTVAIVSALVCVALVRIARWADGAPLGAGLAALGVVFGATGIVWTWRPVGLAELTALHALLVVVAMVAGAGVAAVATRVPAPAIRRRVRAHR